jgi:hypothetical protein
VIETGTPTGFGTSLVFLETGDPMIAYVHQIASGNRGLKVAQFNGTDWVKSVADDGDGGYTGFYPSIALDHNTTGNPVIAYQFQYNGSFVLYNDLNVAWWNGSSWQIGLAEGDGPDPGGLNRNGFYASMQFTSAGVGHIGHYRLMDQFTPTEVRSVKWNGSAWNGSLAYTIPNTPDDKPQACETTSMVLSNGNPVFTVKVANETNIRSFWWNGSSYDEKNAGACKKDSGQFSMAVDSAGNPALAWYDYDADLGEGDLKYVKASGGNWGSAETVVAGPEDVGAYSSVTFASDDTPWISFNHATNQELWVAYKTGSWETDIVDNGGSNNYREGKYTCIRFGPDSKPHISYQQYSTNPNYATKYASLF